MQTNPGADELFDEASHATYVDHAAAITAYFPTTHEHAGAEHD